MRLVQIGKRHGTARRPRRRAASALSRRVWSQSTNWPRRAFDAKARCRASRSSRWPPANRSPMTMSTREDRLASACSHRRTGRTRARPRLRNRPDAPGQRERTAGHARSGRSRRRQKPVTDSMRMFRVGPCGGRPDRRRNRHCAGMVLQGRRRRAAALPLRRSLFPRTQKTAAKKRRSPAIYLIDSQTARRTASACARAMSSPTTNSSGATISILQAQSFALQHRARTGRWPRLSAPSTGEVSIERDGSRSGEERSRPAKKTCAHSLANLEHHHFKFAGHRQPGNVHVHFFGAHSLSFGEGIELKDGDWMQVRFEGYRARSCATRSSIEDKRAAPVDPRSSRWVERSTSDNQEELSETESRDSRIRNDGQRHGKQSAEAGFPVTVYNRTRAKAEPLAAAGARIAETPADAAHDADVIISMLSDETPHARHGPESKERSPVRTRAPFWSNQARSRPIWIAELAGMADARGLKSARRTRHRQPRTGRERPTHLPCGRGCRALESVRPVAGAMSKEIVHLGPSGSGARMKLINNFLCGVQVASLAEALAWIERSSLDREQALKMLKNGAPGSPLLAAISARMVEQSTTSTSFSR